MEQHPIPQDITAYRFRLVGNMTLKQFLELAAGVVSAWLLFSSPVNFLIKWTLGPTLAFLGFALAFIPIEERPLDQWIVNFIKAIYSPTLFIYTPQSRPMRVFEPIKLKPISASSASQAAPEIDEYLKSIPSATSSFDTAEHNYLEHIGNLFGALGTKTSPIKITDDDISPPAATLVKGVRIRKLKHQSLSKLPSTTVFQAPDPITAAMPEVAPAPKPIAKTAPVVTPAKTVATPKPAAAVKPKIAPTPAPAPAPAAPVKAKDLSTNPVFATNIVLPQGPDKPNLISGITLDKAGKILPSVIIEITDSKGHPVRALKSNKLGQFFIATPLDDGIYQISAEANDQAFAIIKLEAKGEIIPPLKIQAK